MGTATILRGDARALPMPDASVDLIVTSPPYWSLRDYRDGDASLEGQIGAESTPADYISNLVDATSEWMRVLKPEGSIWVNLGDKYNSAASGQNGTGSTGLDPARGPKMYEGARGAIVKAVKPKSLLLLPERYRIACVDELGLIARAVLVWSKPNGLPESVTDRVRRSHEDWVHLTKQPRYFAAVDEIRTPASGYSRPNGAARATPTSTKSRTLADTCNPLGALPGSVWEVATEPLVVPDRLGVSHFAAFPTEWPRQIILGWSPSGVCIACGEGRRPVVERRPMVWRESPTINGRSNGTSRKPASGTMLSAPSAVILGETCACVDSDAPTTPATVLDPFGGTGTTALVAKALGRHGISLDRSADYCRLAAWRTTDPSQLAKAMRVSAPAKQVEGQATLFEVAS